MVLNVELKSMNSMEFFVQVGEGGVESKADCIIFPPKMQAERDPGQGEELI